MPPKWPSLLQKVPSRPSNNISLSLSWPRPSTHACTDPHFGDSMVSNLSFASFQCSLFLCSIFDTLKQTILNKKIIILSHRTFFIVIVYNVNHAYWNITIIRLSLWLTFQFLVSPKKYFFSAVGLFFSCFSVIYFNDCIEAHTLEK